MKIRAIECSSARKALETKGRKRAIMIAGKYLVVAREEAHRLEAAGAKFAYICNYKGRIVTVPVNEEREEITMSKKSHANKGGKNSKGSKPRVKGGSGKERPAQAESGAAPATGQNTPKTRKKAERKDGKMSGLDAAAKVLKDAGTPLNTKEMLERIRAQDLWNTKGKTPQATIYSAIIREIALKGDASRFKKTERGHFTVAG